MDSSDQDDIIEKVKKSGMGGDEEDGEDLGGDELENDVEPELDLGDEEGDEELDLGGEDEDLDLGESFNQDGEPYGFDNPTDEESIIRHDLENVLSGYAEEKGLENYTTRIVNYLLNNPKVNGFVKLSYANNMNYDQTFNQLVDMGKAMLRGRGFSGGLDETFDDTERGVEVRALHFKKITSILDKATNMDELGRAVNYIHDNVKLTVKERVALANFHDIKMREFGGDLNIPENNSIFAETNLTEMTEPTIAPPKEKEKEVERETRRKKTWKQPTTTPAPKFSGEDGCEKELITGDEEE
jgi:hypothetical protein